MSEETTDKDPSLIRQWILMVRQHQHLLSIVLRYIRLLTSGRVQDQRESEGVPFVVTGTCVDCRIGGCRHGECNVTSTRCKCDYG